MIRFAAALLITLAGSGFAQEPQQDSNTYLLGGPRVAQTNVTGLTSTFTTQNQNDGAMRNRAAAGLFRRVLAELQTSDDPQVRLSAEQQQEIRRLLESFQKRTADFERAHAAELRQLRAQIRRERSAKTDRPAREPALRDSSPASTGEPMMSDISRAEARMAELISSKPNPLELEKPVRALLNERQLAYLDERIEALSSQIFEERAMERFRRDAARQLGQAEPGQINLNRLPERLRARIEALAPEEREAALERVRRFLAERAETDRISDRRRNRTIRKPPPSLDSVNVPKPGIDD